MPILNPQIFQIIPLGEMHTKLTENLNGKDHLGDLDGIG
jgi:hypothetical protein